MAFYVKCLFIVTLTLTLTLYFSVLGHEKRGKDKGAKNVLVMSSKAKGKDRLTGRARRSATVYTFI